jgi:CubicO group peptidase (beta-lactamase class C family)
VTPAAAAGIERALDSEVGVQICAYRNGELLVDGWAGTADAEGDGDRTVDSRTLFPIFSVSKAITATAVHLQAERGLVQYDAPIASYWPAYGSHGKQDITIPDASCRRASDARRRDARATVRLAVDDPAPCGG